MFVHYRLYKKPVSPIISTPRCGDQGKMVIHGVEVMHEKVKSGRQAYLIVSQCFTVTLKHFIDLL